MQIVDYKNELALGIWIPKLKVNPIVSSRTLKGSVLD